MSISRRAVIKAAGVGTAMTAVSVKAGALGAANNERRSKICITTGLVTDSAFEKSIQADHSLAFSSSGEHFEGLVDAILALKNSDIYALVQPAEAVLIEQAAREANARLTAEITLNAPVSYDRTHQNHAEHSWAYRVGQSLQNTTDASALTAFAGQTFVAIKISV
jgi:hypothetical protein